jgi:hypothetical protein
VDSYIYLEGEMKGSTFYLEDRGSRFTQTLADIYNFTRGLIPEDREEEWWEHTVHLKSHMILNLGLC